MSPRFFVFVEFSDPEVREFLTKLKSAFSCRPKHDVPHITVRGPYSSPPDARFIAELSEKLHGQGVFIADVGMFKTRKGHAVFLHAKSKLFDEVWWKPDFLGPSSRRIPHLTLFETESSDHAQAVMEFLRSEGIELVTYGVELTVYTSKQQSLLEVEALPLPIRRFPQERMEFREGLFERAERLRNHLAAEKNGDGGQQLLI